MREEAQKAYKLCLERDRRLAEEFAEKAAEAFREEFGVKPDEVKPVKYGLAVVTADGIMFAAVPCYNNIQFRLAGYCEKCGALVYSDYDVYSLEVLGGALAGDTRYFRYHPPKLCRDCMGRRKPTVEELLIQVLDQLGVYFGE